MENFNASDLKTGKELYLERTHTSQHRSSPTYADGHLYLCARDGVTSVVKAGPQFELIAQNDLGESITASPVVSNGILYLRTYEALYAIQKSSRLIGDSDTFSRTSNKTLSVSNPRIGLRNSKRLDGVAKAGRHVAHLRS